MSITRADALQKRWSNTGALAKLERALDAIGFTDAYVATAINIGENRSKVVKDSTWGMIEIDPSCVRLLNSPLIQRLRGIKQLGFSYLTYPSAEHTRFIHSLGMYCVVSRFLEIVQRRPAEPSNPDAPYSLWVPDKHQANLMCHAALMHDAGHLPFSHVTEKILQADPKLFRCGPVTVEDFLFAIEDTLERPMALAEAISLAIVLTPRFKEFYTRVVSPGADAADCLRIAALIAGLEPDPRLTGLASLISGTSIDADKIDYINRDARSCGIPIGIDVARLFMRSSFLEVKPDELQRLRSSDEKPSSSEVIFVVNASGLDSIEEIGQARTMLYHRVYLHQTTRNAERLLSKAFESAVRDGDRALKNVFDLWSSDDQELLNSLRKHRSKNVSSFGNRLERRELPKRASAFGRSLVTPCVPIEAIFPAMSTEAAKELRKQIVGTSLEQLRAKKMHGEAQRNIERRISEEATRIARLLRNHNFEAPKGSPTVVSVLPMPNVEPNRSDCIVLENELLNSNGASSVSDEQMEATDIIKSIGYVMTDDQWRDIVFLAAKVVLYQTEFDSVEVELSPYSDRKFSVKTKRRLLLNDDAVMRRVRVHRDKIRLLVNRVGTVGYFDKHRRLAPLGVDEEALARIATRLRGFSGQGGWSVSIPTVKAFLSQFPVSLQKPMSDVLEKIQVLGRTEVATRLAAGIQKIDIGTQHGFIVGLSPDSGSNTRMLAEQELKNRLTGSWTFKKSIRDVFSLAKPGDRLVLCDDNVTSGSQAICQLLAWMGVSESKWTKEQQREKGIERKPLDARDKELFLQMDLWLVTAAGTSRASDYLAREVPKIGISRFGGIHYDMEIGVTDADLSLVEPFLKKVGTSLMIWNRFPGKAAAQLARKDLNACRDDALGYSSARGLFCTPFNVPVGTLTPLWAPGIHEGEPWMPLLIRRGYVENLVLA